MLDRRVLELSRDFLNALAARLAARGIRADQVSWFGFVAGLAAVPLIVLQQFPWAILPVLVNRLADGVDGALARQVGPTDRGAFLDISLDFLFYSSIPLAFAIADPAANALAAPFWRFRPAAPMPQAVFTDPQIARVGPSPAEAATLPHEVTTYPLDDLDRALAEGLELNDAPRYRVRTLPAAGATIKEDDRIEQLTL